MAIPTETVYGLAAWTESAPGLEKIFSIKERPFFDPLIVHIANIENARKLASVWTSAHEVLAQAAWPGPLTLIAKKVDSINPLITSGLDSVGLRCPRHPETLELLKEIQGGLAAPSANRFGKTSPTSSKHVFEEFGNEVAILEGGPCEVGIESTVLGIQEMNGTFIIEIFRPGFYTAKMLTDILLEKGIKSQVKYAESPVAPGQLKHHYMPKIPLVIVPSSFTWENESTVVEKTLNQKILRPALWKLPTEARIASRELYEKMRSFDKQGFDAIIVYKENHHDEEEWLGIWNRLEKAKTFSL